LSLLQHRGGSGGVPGLHFAMKSPRPDQTRRRSQHPQTDARVRCVLRVRWKCAESA
jgi:hypothetical protein